MPNPKGTPQNLTAPRIQKGQVLNPKGRAKGILYVSEWMRVMASWSTGKVQAVLEDEDAPVLQVAAARQMLASAGADDPDVAGRACTRVADRLEGKPAQLIHVAEPDDKTIADRLASLADRVRGVSDGSGE